MLAALPLVLGLGVASPWGGLTLAAAAIACGALTISSRLLAPAVALFATGIVLAVHRGELGHWSVPPLAAALLLLAESAELRHRLPRDAVIERQAAYGVVRQVVLVVAAAFTASLVALAAAGATSRGGAAAGVIGAAAILAMLLLIRFFARSATSRSS